VSDEPGIGDSSQLLINAQTGQVELAAGR